MGEGGSKGDKSKSLSQKKTTIAAAAELKQETGERETFLRFANCQGQEPKNTSIIRSVTATTRAATAREESREITATLAAVATATSAKAATATSAEATAEQPEQQQQHGRGPPPPPTAAAAAAPSPQRHPCPSAVPLRPGG